MDKKTASITIKTTEETKTALERIATEKEWSISQLCNKILTEHLSNTGKPQQN